MQKKEGSLLLIVLYVDDLLITGSSVSRLRIIKSTLNKAFTVTDLGLIRKLLFTHMALLRPSVDISYVGTQKDIYGLKFS